MSYDAYIGELDANYTSNMASLFYDHIPGGLKAIDGLTGREAAASLAEAFDKIDRTYIGIGRTSFRSQYDAVNGWGSTDGALIFLARIMAACAANPRKRVRVSW